MIFQGARNSHSIQVHLGGTANATGCKVNLEGSMDLANYGVIATWDLAAGQVDGDIISVDKAGIIGIQANLATLSGGTAPTVTVNYIGTDG